MTTSLLIDHGRVACPLRGDTDIETCWACPIYAGQITRRGHEEIRCRVSRVAPLPLPLVGA